MSADVTLEFRHAIREAIIEEMERDETVVFFGEDVAAEQGGVFAVTPGIQERFGAGRVFDTPISELAITGAAFGAAVTGLRPIIEIMFGDFMGLSMDSLVNQSAKYWYLSNEQRSVPLVVRSAVGGGGRFGAIHSQTHATWFQAIAGLKIVFPSSPAEAKGLLKAAIRDDNPVIFLEHKRLYSIKGHAPAAEEVIPLGRARIARPGHDLTIVSVGKGVPDALEAAERLAGEKASTPRSSTCGRCGRSTSTPCSSRCHEPIGWWPSRRDPRVGGWASGLLGLVAEHGLHDLDDAWLLTTGELPIPYSPILEDAFIPGADAIVAAVSERARRRRGGLK